MRAAVADLPARVDLVIIGGGVTGAGLLREASRTQASVLLIEQGDFASGTSSRSSKLVHGGLRYLKTGQWRLTLESVRERERLLREAAGLVERQPFLMPIYRGVPPGRFTIRAGLWLYDQMAGGTASSRWIGAEGALALEPELRREGLLGAMLYDDARTDDARLVIRLILESVSERARALNYVKAAALLRAGNRVRGVAIEDKAGGGTREIEAAVVVNATGAAAGQWAEGPPLRPLRGSHFVFPVAQLPLTRAVSWLHPADRRPIFAYPWEGATLYGTTDVDQGQAPLEQPRMGREEAQYLLDGLAHQFPGLGLKAEHALCRYAGVRPVVSSGAKDPSAESRESALWTAPGIVNMAGGKLTTFRVHAREILGEAARQEPKLAPAADQPLFEPASASDRLHGRLGPAADRLRAETAADEQAPLTGTPYSLAELRWSARHEHVIYLDDLLLRRTRIGLTATQGARPFMARIRDVCRQELGWDEARWVQEEGRYWRIWNDQHAPEGAA